MDLKAGIGSGSADRIGPKTGPIGEKYGKQIMRVFEYVLRLCWLITGRYGVLFV